MILKNRFFISCLLLLGFCLLASAEVSEEDATVVEQFVPESCKVDKIEKADLDGDSKSELAFTYIGEEKIIGIIEKIGLIILKWNGVKYMKQWEWEYESDILSEIKWLKVQDVTNDGKPEILLFWHEYAIHWPLAVFTWGGKTYKLLGANGAEEGFYSEVDMPDVAPGIVHVYRCSPLRGLTYPKTYKWDGSKFVLYGIRNGRTFVSMRAEFLKKTMQMKSLIGIFG